MMVYLMLIVGLAVGFAVGVLGSYIVGLTDGMKILREEYGIDWLKSEEADEAVAEELPPLERSYTFPNALEDTDEWS